MARPSVAREPEDLPSAVARGDQIFSPRPGVSEEFSAAHDGLLHDLAVLEVQLPEVLEAFVEVWRVFVVGRGFSHVQSFMHDSHAADLIPGPVEGVEQLPIRCKFQNDAGPICVACRHVQQIVVACDLTTILECLENTAGPGNDGAW